MLANASLDIAFHDTYYVVAQMGLNNINYSAIDYMLKTMFLEYYLILLLNYYLPFDPALDAHPWFRTRVKGSKIDEARRNSLLTMSIKNNNKSVTFNNFNKCANIQSAENCKGFSETIRQLSNTSDTGFYS